MAFASGPLLNVRIDLFPAAQVEIAYTEIRALRQAEGFLERGEKGLLDVIEDAGHKLQPSHQKISWILRKLGSADKAINRPEAWPTTEWKRRYPYTLPRARIKLIDASVGKRRSGGAMNDWLTFPVSLPIPQRVLRGDELLAVRRILTSLSVCLSVAQRILGDDELVDVR